MVEYGECKERNADHHGEGGEVVGVGGGNEALVLVVAQRPNRNLNRVVDSRVAQTVVVDLELENPVNVRQGKVHRIHSIFVAQGRSDKGVQSMEVHLHVRSSERHPLALKSRL